MRTSSCLRLCFGVCLLALSAAAAAQNAVTTHSVDVYAGPDDSYPTVAQLDIDSPVQVMGCLDDWSWCDVVFADNRGWVYAPDIVYDYQGGYVPLYTYAPGLGIPVVQFTIGGYWDRYYHGRPWYSQRDEWVGRGPPQHRRPPGPPPSAGPPPRSARVERPSHEAQPERPLRLGSAGSAEQPNREAERRDGARENGDARPPEQRAAPPPQPRDARPPAPREARSPEPHAAPPPEARDPRPPEPHAAPPPEARDVRPPAPHDARPPEPPRHEERAPTPPRPEAARPEGTHHGEKPGDRPNDSPR